MAPSTLPLTISIGAAPGGSFDGGVLSLSGIEQLEIEASAGDDTITGGAFDDIINARDGSNSVNGGGGDDLITVYTGGANIIDGGSGDDTLARSILVPIRRAIRAFSLMPRARLRPMRTGPWLTNVENFQVRAQSGADHDILFGPGNDSLLSGDGDDSAIGGAGDDSLTGWRGADTLRGGEGNDHIIGGTGSFNNSRDGADLIFGDAGNDTLEGDEGADLIEGGAGRDILLGGYIRQATEYGDQTPDTLRGGSGNDDLYEGFNGGRPERDQMFGEGGDDRFFLEGRGESSAHGGSGTDTVVFVNRSLDFDVTFSILGADSAAGIVSDGYTLTSIERLQITLGGGDNTLTGGDLDDFFSVADGQNVITAGGGDDIVRVDVGTPLNVTGFCEYRRWGRRI